MFSLIVVENKEAFALHRLVQIHTRSTLRAWQETALRVLPERFPTADYDNRQQCKLLSPHAQEVIGYIYEPRDVLVRQAKLLNDLARLRFLAKSIFSCFRALQRSYLNAKGSICSLGQVLFHRSKYSDAARMLRTLRSMWLIPPKLFADLEGMMKQRRCTNLPLRDVKLIGSDLIAMKNVENFGSVLHDDGRLDQAEKWVRKAFDARAYRQVILPNLGSASHLAMVLRLRGNLDEAEVMNKRALAGFERVFGHEHHFTL